MFHRMGVHTENIGGPLGLAMQIDHWYNDWWEDDRNRQLYQEEAIFPRPQPLRDQPAH